MTPLNNLPLEEQFINPTTRADWQRVCLQLISPILAHASPAGARVYLPGGRASESGRESDSLEGFARSLWMAGPWLAAHRSGTAEVDGWTYDLATHYRRGFIAGTDPSTPESWYPLLTIRQTLLEACALAWNLWLARHALWEPLSVGERRRVLAWLEAASAIPPHDQNWRLSSVIVLTVIKLLGGKYSQKAIDRHLDRVESFYLGDGWYDDGNPRRHRSPHLDYYNAWVIHPYLLYWSQIDGDAQPGRRARIVQRARLFLETYAYWFGPDGSFPCFGRSAMYRMAVTAVFPWAILGDACPLPFGQVRRICRLVLRRFLQEPGTLDPGGQFTMGFFREYLPMTDRYSGPGSPYWAGKAFGLLALPERHPFWTTPEEPLPIERGDYTVAVPAAGFLLHGSRETGQVQMVNGQSIHYAKQYTNLVYSTHFGYEIDRERQTTEPDPFGEACLTFSVDGENWYGRQTACCLGIHEGVLLTEATHSLGEWGPLVLVLSAVTFVGEQQLRVHQVTAPRPIYAREGGFACGFNDDTLPTLSGGAVSHVAAVAVASGIRPLVGYDEAPEPRRGDCNVLHTRSAVPQVRTTTRRRGDFYLGSVSLARAPAFSPDEVGRVMTTQVGQLLALLEKTPGWTARPSTIASPFTALRVVHRARVSACRQVSARVPPRLHLQLLRIVNRFRT